MQICVNMWNETTKKKSVWNILTVGAAPLTDDKNSEGLESQKYWYTTWHKFLLLICSAAVEMDSDNWGWCWLNMKGSPASDLYYLVGIQGYTVLIHFRLSAVYLFHRKVMLRIFIRILQTGTVVLDNALPILVFIQLLSVSLTFDSFSQLHVHLSHFCCSQYPSSQRVMSVEVKFLPQIKWSEMKMLPRRVLRLVTLMETGPLSGLAEAPHFP